jgi:S1-C subfamily serine protease
MSEFDPRPGPGYDPAQWPQSPSSQQSSQQQPPQQLAPPQWPPYPPPPRRGRGLAVALGVLGLAVVVGIGVAGWNIGRQSNTTAPETSFRPYQAQPPVASPAPDPSSVATKVASGLVDINTTLGFQGGQAAGTGIVLTADGEVLTNNHVVEGATQIQVTDIANGQTYPGTVVGYDRAQDIAVLRLQGASGLTTATTGDSSRVAVGDQILGIGNAGGAGGDPSVAPGTVTALDQSITASDQSGGNAEQLTGLIQVNANIQPGDSGGALADSSGQVIGVNTAASPSYRLGRRGGQVTAAEGFAIPINQALTVAHQIESGTASSTVHIGESAVLGVTVGDASASGVSGAAVGQVLASGPGAQAGLTAGSVITSVDGTTIDSATTLTHVMDQHHPGDNIALTWLDQSQRQHTATVKLAKGPVG